MRKIFIISLVILILIALILAPIIHSILNYGAILIGSGWRDSPEEVIEYNIQDLYDMHQEEKEGCYRIKNLIDEIRFENELYYIYISEANSFSVMNMVFDDKREKWHFSGLYVYHYDENIEITSDYDINVSLWKGPHCYFPNDESTVFGFMETGIAESYYVNGVKANVKVYTFEENGKTYSIDYFYTDWPEGIEYEEIDVCYKEYVK